MSSSPQLEDGYTRIADELLDKIIERDFSKREYKILLAVIRKTYGFNKKFDNLSLSQIAILTNLDPAHISRTIKDLVDKKVLLKQQGQYAQSIGINKKHNEWLLLPKQQGVAKTAIKGCQNSNKTIAKTATTIDNSIDNTIDKKPLRLKNKFSDNDMTTAKWIYKKLKELNTNTKQPNFEAWANTIRLMTERDNRDHKSICRVFKFANSDPFWQEQILSPKNLRKHFDRLTLRMKKANSNETSNGLSNSSHNKKSTTESFWNDIETAIPDS